jgi:hypothetical protein
MRVEINDRAIIALRAKVVAQLAIKLESAEEVARLIAPVDTSSLSASIRSGVEVSGSQIIGRLAAGGEDFSDTYFASTQQMGNYVDYAGAQEAIHGFMDAAIGDILTS